MTVSPFSASEWADRRPARSIIFRRAAPSDTVCGFKDALLIRTAVKNRLAPRPGFGRDRAIASPCVKPAIPHNSDYLPNRSAGRNGSRLGLRRGDRPSRQRPAAPVAGVLATYLRQEQRRCRCGPGTSPRCSSANRAANRTESAAASPDRSAWNAWRCSNAPRPRRAASAGARFPRCMPSFQRRSSAPFAPAPAPKTVR